MASFCKQWLTPGYEPDVSTPQGVQKALNMGAAGTLCIVVLWYLSAALGAYHPTSHTSGENFVFFALPIVFVLLAWLVKRGSYIGGWISVVLLGLISLVYAVQEVRYLWPIIPVDTEIKTASALGGWLLTMLHLALSPPSATGFMLAAAGVMLVAMFLITMTIATILVFSCALTGRQGAAPKAEISRLVHCAQPPPHRRY
jgi:hypothetical protein